MDKLKEAAATIDRTIGATEGGAAALASCTPPEAAAGTACDRDRYRDCAAARASCAPLEATGTARDRRLPLVLLLPPEAAGTRYFLFA
ncbi:hypothetical protein WN944_011122 [Citrus x changshan-huyou]|uniref:Uncharacterized protein n=1 Tax=Citrus x changshan-huyou TaxID=2935761 RepID=A0AAP0QYH0_9ROSI